MNPMTVTEEMMLNGMSGGDMRRKLLLTAEEAAEMLGVGRTTVYRMLARNELRSIKIGSSRRIPFVSLTEYVDRVLAHTEPTAS